MFAAYYSMYHWIRLVHFTSRIEFFFACLLGIIYAYQLWYIILGLIGLQREKRRQRHNPVPLHRFAALISARNEAAVIGQLIQSLKEQTYPTEFLDIWVIADNCTDNTAAAARQAGARVMVRNDRTLVGKGYALDWFFRHLRMQGLADHYDAYLVFDADNIVDAHFVEEMNRTFSQGGYDAITSYRNSKNFGDNWISAGYSLWYLRESRFLNYPRQLQKTNCAISGTGFLVSSEAIRRNGGWPFHLLTEDIQFSADCAARGFRIGYCDRAMVFDEQPTGFVQSWHQRMRWSKGFYQVDRHYTVSLLRGILQGGRRGFSSYDIFVTVAPGMLLSVALLLLNILLIGTVLFTPHWVGRIIINLLTYQILDFLMRYYVGMLAIGLITLITERKRIRANMAAQFGYLLTFPLFMLTYFPIALCSLFQKVEWKPIQHHAVKTEMSV